MNTLFHEAASAIDIPSVKAWKASGKKVVGYTCSFMPVEVFHAAGILPVRQRGIHAHSMEIGDAYYGPFVCSFPKAVLQLIGSGHYSFLDGAVITTGCDSMRRLDECWRKMAEDIEGTLPSWFHYFDVPHKPDGHAFDWYADQVKKMIAAIEKHFDCAITDDKLKEAIQKQNEIRKRMCDLMELRAQTPARISGTDAYAALIAQTVMPQDEYLSALSKLIEHHVSQEPPSENGKKRLFVGGSLCDDVDLIRLIESSKAVVVGENICFGVRGVHDLIREDGDPVHALTERYLSGSVCPRMFGYYNNRLSAITGHIRHVNADGVILQSIRFCDMHGSENGLLERDLDKMGIPSVRVEKEYGPLTETGRLKMRVDAFLEQIGKRS